MPIPTLKPVTSAAMKAHGFDPATQTLYIQFHSGDVWSYPEVSNDLYAGLLGAESAGKFYAANIKGAYKGTFVKDDEPKEPA